MAFLERVNSHGFTYLYLNEYAVRKNYSTNRMTIYRFGRIENALEKMYRWQNNFSEFPNELKKLGFNKYDLNKWIDRVENMKTEIKAI